jgi:hypothetical protein
MDSANLLQVLIIPDCVGPAAVTDVVVDATVDDVDVGVLDPETPTQ